jgi:hypothetical protein
MGRPKVRRTWSSKEELETEVLETCRAKFLEKYGVAWDDSWGKGLVRDHKKQIRLDRDARKLFEKVRATVEQANAFLRKESCRACLALDLDMERLGYTPLGGPPTVAGASSRRVGGALYALDRWLRLVELDSLWILPELNAPFPKSFHGYLIVRFQYAVEHGGRGLPPELTAPFKAMGCACEPKGTLPSDHELAVISLLSEGAYPSVTPIRDDDPGGRGEEIRVSDVIAREKRAITLAREHLEPSVSNATDIPGSAKQKLSLEEVLRLAFVGEAAERAPRLQPAPRRSADWSWPRSPARSGFDDAGVVWFPSRRSRRPR